MRWTGWDIGVSVLFVVQALCWTAVFLVLRRIRQGPVQTLSQRASTLAGNVAPLRLQVERFGEQLRRVRAIAEELARTRQALHLPPSPEGMLVTPATLRRGIGAAKVARSVLGVGRKSGERRRVQARRSVAQRLGLVPPIFSRLDWLGRAAKIAWRLAREVQRRR